ncbi:hypothetical protein KR222_004811, partial [Zaprionus bogoriensis]
VFGSAALFMLTPGWTFVVKNGPCSRNLTALGNFDMNKYLGKWYPQTMYPDFSNEVPFCKSISLFKAGSGFKLRSRSIDPRSGTVKLIDQNILSVDSGAGKYILKTNNKGFSDGIEVYVLDTDYKTYGIHYMCFDAEQVVSFHWAAIYTRSRLPTLEVMDIATMMAKASGLMLDKFVSVPQDGCPIDS